MKVPGKFIVVLFSTVLAISLVIGALLGQEQSSQEPYLPLAVLSEVLSRIESDYVEDPDLTRVTEGALRGLLASLDPYSSYLTPEEYREYQGSSQGEASIGAVISKRFDFASIVTVLPNSPVQKAGLLAGDMIESVNRRSTREMSLAELNSMLAGPEGSTVEIAVVRERAADPKLFQLQRVVTVLPDVTGRIVSPGIGYLRMEAFPKGASEQVAARIQELRQSGADKFVLDLRDNASGEIEEAIATANLFLKRGLISYLSGQQYPRRSFIADPDKAISEEPLVVLVNQFTGGGAEILSAAVMDNRRGEVVGEKTYGIGAIQELILMDDGSALILSIAKYFSPSGKEIQNNGITPSVPVAEEREFISLSGEEGELPEPQTSQPREDAPFKRAIELLNAVESQPQAA